jgi:hypothetical protein
MKQPGSNSRTLSHLGFRSDGGLPFSGSFSKVNHKTYVPTNAICLVVVVNMALMSIYFGSVTGFGTILAISTEGFCKFGWAPRLLYHLLIRQCRLILYHASCSSPLGSLDWQRPRSCRRFLLIEIWLRPQHHRPFIPGFCLYHFQLPFCSSDRRQQHELYLCRSRCECSHR